MATARELLEQADALMRRNRTNALDDIPVLTDVMPAADVRGAVPAPTPRPVVDPGPSSVPLLTEDIEVVDEDTLGADVVEGEPSAWLEFEDTDPSVIGDAPDSVAIVPPFERRARPPDEALMASAEHEEIELTWPGEETPAAPPPVEVTSEVTVDYAFGDAAATTGAADDKAAEVTDEPVEVTDEPAAVTATPATFTPVVASPTFMHAPPLEPAPPITAAAMAAAASVRLSPPEIAAQAAVEPVAPVAPPALSMSNDDERWVAVAEEIRMQVLQRIDLFTDAGLRDQLALRLQPIADRASADFVTAINLHVGDLLRTYVAEAIEREIERWRRDH
jgi:hypothetical protein